MKPDIKKAIYSDVDVIFNGDIKELFEEDLENKVIGAVHDFINFEDEEFKAKHYSKLDINLEHKYLWLGLLLIDCNKFRENSYEKKILDSLTKYSDKLLWPDNDILNNVFQKNCKLLHPRYVFIPQFTNKMISKDIEHKETVRKPFIYHYADKKPWKNKQLKCAEMFWDIAAQSSIF